MNARVFKRLKDDLTAAISADVVLYNVDQQVDFEAHRSNGKAWVKVYGPSQEGGGEVVEGYLVIIDCGAVNVERARRASEQVRQALKSTRRAPNGYRLVRLQMLEEASYVRFQHGYRLTQAPTAP